MIRQAKNAPDIDNYLTFLVTENAASALDSPVESLHGARSAASMMLKNNIKSHYRDIPQESQDYIKSNVVLALQDSNAQIRNYVGNVISELVHQAGIVGSPEIIPKLLSLVANESGSIPDHVQAAAMTTVYKICEDNKRILNKTYQERSPLDFLIPRLLGFMLHPLAKVRAKAVESMDAFIPDKSTQIVRTIDDFISRLFQLSEDDDDDVRRMVCRSLAILAEAAPTKIAPHMEGLLNYVLKQQQDEDDEELALDAAEFVLTVSEQQSLRQHLQPFLDKVVPVLLKSMIWREDDVLRLEGDDEDAEVEDKSEDIRPAFAKPRAARLGHEGADANGASSINGASVSYSYEEDDLSEGEIEEYMNDDANDETSWNLRKCSAATLDGLAGNFPDAVFSSTLPFLMNNFQHAEWPHREAAVLAIGAIADGCMQFVEPQLPDLIPFLVSRLQDQQAVVRQISCWSLCRYSMWAAHLDDVNKEKFFLPMMDGILKRMLDSNKRVQEAAASAFANLEEKANTQLENLMYCKVITTQFAECCAKYKTRNVFLLYDCIQTLAEHVGPLLQHPELVQTLMPALLQRWERLSDHSPELFSLLECLSYIASALGTAFLPYSQPIFERCLRIIYQNLQDSLSAVENPALDAPAPDSIITSLDLLSAIIQISGPDISMRLVSEAQPSIFDLMHFCMENPSSEVRQSAYALLGDCAIFVFAALQPRLDKLLPILMQHLDVAGVAEDADEKAFAVTNNACWSCGEISVRALDRMDRYAESLLQKFFAIISERKAPRSLQENAAMAIGRLGVGCPEKLAPHAITFAPPFLQRVKLIEPTDEKIQAMQGISEVASRNPQCFEHCLVDFVHQIASFNLLQEYDVGTPMRPFQSFQKVRESNQCLQNSNEWC